MGKEEKIVSLIPCRKCITMAVCINRERVQCRKLREYLLGKGGPRRIMRMFEYKTLFKCDGVTTLKEQHNFTIKAYKSKGVAYPTKYYFVIEPTGLHSIIKDDVVMR